MAPDWLTVLAWFYLSVCFCSAGFIIYDVALNHRRQPMGVMNFVYPITALYFGPLALAVYWRWARADAGTGMAPMSSSQAAARQTAMPAEPVVAGDRAVGMPLGGNDHRGAVRAPGPGGAARQPAPGERGRPWWVTVAIEVSHCGAGCALGDVISEFAIFALGLTIAGSTLWAEYAGDYVLALALGIIFQYFAIAPMRGLGLKDGLLAAAKADFASLTAFQVGLFGWMAVMTFVLFPAPHTLMPNSAAFWLLMQVGMIIGYFTSWPANVWLIRRGIKVPMSLNQLGQVRGEVLPEHNHRRARRRGYSSSGCPDSNRAGRKYPLTSSPASLPTTPTR